MPALHDHIGLHGWTFFRILQRSCFQLETAESIFLQILKKHEKNEARRPVEVPFQMNKSNKGEDEYQKSYAKKKKLVV